MAHALGLCGWRCRPTETSLRLRRLASLDLQRFGQRLRYCPAVPVVAGAAAGAIFFVTAFLTGATVFFVAFFTGLFFVAVFVAAAFACCAFTAFTASYRFFVAAMIA